MNISKKNKRNRVSFFHRAFVVLIPTAEEYHSAGIGSHIWYTNNDFDEFRYSAIQEMRAKPQLTALVGRPQVTARQVMKAYINELLEHLHEDSKPSLLSRCGSDGDELSKSPNSVTHIPSYLV